MTRRRGRAEPQPPADLGAALQVAFKFLGTRPRTRAEIVRRLQKAGAEETLIEACVSRLGELGYVDDLAFVRYWTEQRDTHSPRSQVLVDMELRRLGIDAETVQAYRDGADDTPEAARGEAVVETERRRALDALQRRLRGRRLDPSDRVAVKRALDFLARRGFGYETARTAVRVVAAVDERRAADGDDIEAFGEAKFTAD